jgi:hypothetical protein
MPRRLASILEFSMIALVWVEAEVAAVVEASAVGTIEGALDTKRVSRIPGPLAGFENSSGRFCRVGTERKPSAVCTIVHPGTNRDGSD